MHECSGGRAFVPYLATYANGSGNNKWGSEDLVCCCENCFEMDASTTNRTSYAFGATEWLNYLKYRPKYPPSLVQLVKSYHQEHSGQYNLAHDVASGSGVFVPALAEDFGFKHIHVSDPGPVNLSTAQRILTQWLGSSRDQPLSPEPILTFSQTTAEEMHLCAASHTVDLVTIMEAAHWMDGPKMMTSAATTLRPAGTLAMVIYCVAPHIKDSTRANTAFKKVMGNLWRHILQEKKSLQSTGVAEIERGLQQGCTLLNWVDIDHAVWMNIKRVRIRGGNRGEYPGAIPYADSDSFAPSNVKPDEVYQHYEEGDEEAAGWYIDVDQEWFHGYLTSMENPEHVASMDEYGELMHILQEDFAEAKVPIEWTTDIVLATRR